MRCRCLAFFLVGGCSAIVNPDPGRLGAGADSGVTLLDAGNADAGTPDAGPPPDTGPPCMGPDRCEGEVLVRCRDGVTTLEDCRDRSSYCQVDRCQSWVCTPSERECTSDLRGLVVCSSRGDSETTTPCELGCNVTTNACITISPACAGAPRINVGGRATFDLCRETNGDTYEVASDCPSSREALAGDRTFLLVLDRDMDLIIELTDADVTAAVDTVVYVRRVCDQPGTQIACDDDVPCSESTVLGGCSGEIDVRQSRIETRLSAGSYYVIADAFAYSTERTTYRCGSVQLRVSER